MMNRQAVIAVILALAAGAAGGYFVAGKSGPAQDPAMTGAPQEREPLFYRNPMNPAITSPVPAKDEMGMDYIPVYANGMDDGRPSGSVSIDPVVSQNMGVRSAPAVRKTLTRDIRTVGHVDFDEKLLTRLHPKVEGWVEELFVDSTGIHVSKDTMLLSLYSPQLVSTEEEYMLALKNAEKLKKSSQRDIREGAERLARAALERLQYLDVPAHQLEALKRDGKIMKNLHIHSPFDGVVISLGVRKGQFVTPKTEMYTIADLTRIWVYVHIYEDEIPWVREGDTALMNVTGIPGRIFTGKVSYVYPYLDPKTRTNKVRLEFSNQDLALKPEMYAHVTLNTSIQTDAIVVPVESIVRTGNREQVFIVKGDGKFEPRQVSLGVTTGPEVQIISGIAEGEMVVTSSQFLIDSESKLNEATAKMMDANKAAEDMAQPMDAPPLMDDMSMEGMRLDGPMADMSMEGMSLDSPMADMSMEGMSLENPQ